jgi:hypothetical protein
MSPRQSPGALLVARRIEEMRGKAVASRPGRAAPARAARRAGDIAEFSDTAAIRDLPTYVIFALARWRLLNDVPFRYLVPDTRLLPDESIRFFTLDEEWLDAMVSGALIAGGGGTRELAQAQAALPGSLIAASRHRAFVRDVLRGRLTLSNLPEPAAAASTVVSGFLLRSALVSGWPATQIRAWASDDLADVPRDVDPSVLAASRPELVVPILRLERLSPAVLMVLFEGVPRLVWLEEPHHGVQYGVDAAGAGFTVTVRNAPGSVATVAVTMRAGSTSGVIDVTALAAAIDAARPLPHPRGSAALAAELLQAPARQRFTASAATGGPA